MNLSFLEEPNLEFGAGQHIDIRFGIMNYGPLDFEAPIAPRQMNIGIVGTTESVDGARQWLERCRTTIPAKLNKDDPTKPNKQPNLFARFPGFSPETGFHSTLVLQDSLCRSDDYRRPLGPSRNHLKQQLRRRFRHRHVGHLVDHD